jgi:benzodiazapine receptor
MKIPNAYLATLNVFALLLTLTVNALANILPINGMNTGEVSALYPSLFTPVGLTFSIWSVIYLLLVAFTFYQFTCVLQPYFRLLSILFIGSCLFNSLWILAWHFLLPELSVLIMAALLITLTQIFLLVQRAQLLKASERWLIRLPFTVYLAWICVATIANMAAMLATYSDLVNAVNPTAVTVIMLLVAAFLGAFVSWRYRAPAFSLVVIWAFYGIYLRWNATDFSAIAQAALILLVALAGIAVVSGWRYLQTSSIR